MYQTSQREDTRYDIFGPLVEDAIYVHGSDMLVVATQMTRCRDHSEHMLVVREIRILAVANRGSNLAEGGGRTWVREDVDFGPRAG